MIRHRIALALGAFFALTLFGSAAAAQQTNAAVVAACGTPPATYPAGSTRPITQDTTGTLCSAGGGGGGGTTTVKANATAPSWVEGSTTNPLSGDLHGSLRTTILDATGTAIDYTADVPVTLAPSAASTAGVAPVASSAAETGHVIKASAGNLVSFQVSSAGSAGFAMVHNSTTVPAAGAVTPVGCFPLAANSTVAITYAPYPMYLSTGISISFSTTGCFTQTDSATAFIVGQAK